MSISALILQSPIGNAEAQSARHAIHAKTARERAIIFLRLLAGECNWSDGAERRLDDCFEMGDGDHVVRWLLKFAAAEPFLQSLLSTHSSVGPRCFAEWQQKYAGEPEGELALS